MNVSRREELVTIETGGVSRTIKAIRKEQGRYALVFGGYEIREDELRWTDGPAEDAALIAWRDLSDDAEVNETEVAEIAEAISKAINLVESDWLFDQPDTIYEMTGASERVEEISEKLVGVGVVRVSAGEQQAESVVYCAEHAEISNGKRSARVIPILSTDNTWPKWRAVLDNGVTIESGDLELVAEKAYWHVVIEPSRLPGWSCEYVEECHQTLMALRHAAESCALMMREIEELEEM